jgi:hypothetical protein
MKAINARHFMRNLQFLNSFRLVNLASERCAASSSRASTGGNGLGFFVRFPKWGPVHTTTPALGKGGWGVRLSSPLLMGPNFWKGDPYPADGTRRVEGAA